MIHTRYRELMAAALDEPLAPADRAALREHLQGCAPCQSIYEALAEVNGLFQLAPTVAPPAGFAERMQRRLAARTSRPRLIGGGLLLTLAAAVILGLVALPIGLLVNAVVQQPSLLIALVRALALALSVLGSLAGGLWLALTALLDWSGGQPAFSGLALACVPLAALWIYFFNRLTPKALTA